VVCALNAPRQWRYEQELQTLGPLPAFRFADYELLTVRVRSTSTIEVRQVVYSVPPSLIGHQVTVRLHHDRLIVYPGSDWVCQLPRVYGHGSHGPRAAARRCKPVAAAASCCCRWPAGSASATGRSWRCSCPAPARVPRGS
jgi:hypothetical protein